MSELTNRSSVVSRREESDAGVKLNQFKISDTVGEIVAARPALSRIFEQSGIDYCCGGKKSLEQVCREKSIDPRALLTALEEGVRSPADGSLMDPATLSLSELTRHIEQTHHAYLRSEFPRLDKMTEKVASVHGGKDARLHQVRETFLALEAELSSHMMKEEQILFPLIRELESGQEMAEFHCGTLANPIRQMEMEHEDAGSALKRLRELTDAFAAPEWACNTYRALLEALASLEQDLHQHIHKENNVLFPRTLEMEERQRTASTA